MSFARNFASSVLKVGQKSQIAGASINSRTFVTSRALRKLALTEAITDDHRKLSEYYNEIVNSDDNDHKECFGNQFTWELARHSVAEELIVYPAFEKYIPGGLGEEHAEKDRKQHHKLKELLKDFQNMKVENPEYVPQLKRLYKHLKEHIKEEESDDLPALERVLELDENRGNSESLAKTFSRTKAFVPSRSHPAAGENPYIEGTVGLPVAIFDHIADLFRKYPNGKISPNPSTK